MASVHKWLAVVPAVAVFAFLVGAIRAGSAPPQPVTPSEARDAWDIPVAKHGEVPADMLAITSLPERIAPDSEAEFNRKAGERVQMPATKAPVAFFSETYDEYVKNTARRNRLRITRFWYSRGTANPLATELATTVGPVVSTCADHSWAFGREYTVGFELGADLAGINVTTDGSPALTECFTKHLADWTKLGSSNRKSKPGTKMVVSFVAMKN